MEAFYLEQDLMDQRAFAAAFDGTFAQARHSLPCTAAADFFCHQHLHACCNEDNACLSYL